MTINNYEMNDAQMEFYDVVRSISNQIELEELESSNVILDRLLDINVRMDDNTIYRSYRQDLDILCDMFDQGKLTHYNFEWAMLQYIDNIVGYEPEENCNCECDCEDYDIFDSIPLNMRGRAIEITKDFVGDLEQLINLDGNGSLKLRVEHKDGELSITSSKITKTEFDDEAIDGVCKSIRNHYRDRIKHNPGIDPFDDYNYYRKNYNDIPYWLRTIGSPYWVRWNVF